MIIIGKKTQSPRRLLSVAAHNGCGKRGQRIEHREGWLLEVRSVELSAMDISCNHCKNTIENGITGIAGVSSVEVDIEAKRVTVVFDEYRAKTDTVLAEMAELGYPAEVIAG